MLIALAFLIGIVAGLRALTAPAVISWAAWLGWLHLAGTPLAFLGHVAAPWIFTVLALGELVGDQLPKTPSRKVPVQFATRLVSGALCGAALAAPSGQLVAGLVAGIVGAVAGTLGGAAARAALARAFGRDLPAGLLEDVVAIAAAWLDRLRRALMDARSFDAIVIGAGQAGPPLAIRLAKAGRRVALVERKLFGGTCVNTGCIPTKALVASAYAAHLARRLADYGVVAGGAPSAST